MDNDSLLPQRHPRYEEESKVTKSKTTKNSSQERTPESRTLYQKFSEKFEEVHGYKYPGHFFRDTGNLQIFLKQNGINFDTVSAMIDYLFDEKRGYWGSSIANIKTICYNDSSLKILDAVRKKQKFDAEASEYKSKFGTL